MDTKSIPSQIESPEDLEIYLQTQDVIDSLKKSGVKTPKKIKNDKDLEKRLIKIKQNLEKKGTLPAEPYLSPGLRSSLETMDESSGSKGGKKRKTKKKNIRKKKRTQKKKFRKKNL